MSGTLLWAEYLNRHVPVPRKGRPAIRHRSASECAKTAFEYIEPFASALTVLGADPVTEKTDRAVEEVDAALIEIVITGTLDSLGQLSVEGICEILSRLTWTVTALTLEDEAGSSWSLPVPAEVSEDVQTIVTLLALLAGPGRNYPPEHLWQQPDASL
jgi:hypothetical protein